MADRHVDYLLIGGGGAGANCARTLREEGADGSILLVGREADPPYSRPPLSKAYLTGKASREDALLFEDGWWGENEVELLTRTSVMKLDVGERVAKLSTREEVGFDKALLATGANVVRLRAEGGDLEGLHYLRSFGNADAIRADAAEAEEVVLIGGSFIACEVAATLTSLGKRCSLVMQEGICLERALGGEVARFFHGVLTDRGVEVIGSDELERYEGSDGRVGKVVTKAGHELPAGCVVIGAGVTPDVMLARSGGLELGDSGGIACSAQLETSAPGVFAAGDVAEWEWPIAGRRLRLEHWEVAAEHGKTAARNMLGQDRPHETVPYFWSDLADWASLEYVGYGSGEEPVIRGSLEDGDFTALYLGDDEGRVTAALTVGRSDDLEHARRMIGARTAPAREALADESTDLGEL